MMFTNLDDIYDSDNKYDAIIAHSLSDSGALWNVNDPAHAFSMATYTFDTTAMFLPLNSDEIFTVTIGGPVKPNPTKENLIKQIQNIPANADFYESDEHPPDQATKEDAKEIILGVSPSGLLAGADVYGYYGEINICWETQRRKLKLIVPPHDSHRQMSLYHGQMQQGVVIESDTEHNVTVKALRTWLDWLQG